MERCSAILCKKCNRRSTGWIRINGMCPACAQGVCVMTKEELLEERRAQLARAEAEIRPGRVRDAYIRQIEMDIERIMNRLD